MEKSLTLPYLDLDRFVILLGVAAIEQSLEADAVGIS